MCGIAGIATIDRADPALVDEMISVLVHRGPDSGGRWCSSDGRVVLGHRRLAVLDLTEAAAQPMITPDGAVAIVFNGELYNHIELRQELTSRGIRFTTRSDTEVLLQAYCYWGDQFLERLDGMFAFAIFDREAATVLLARDRAGEKPLYYALNSTRLTFASEPGALLRDVNQARHLDIEAFNDYLAFGFVGAGASMFKGVSRIEPAEALLFNVRTGESKRWSYWGLPADDSASQRLSQGQLERRLELLLEQSVAERLIADVPVAVMLSGGIDSGLITAIASRVARRLETFTVTFPGAAGLDEAALARSVAARFQTHHTEVMGSDLTPDVVVDFASALDEPLGDSSFIPTGLLCRLIRGTATVALGGDGGDELFGGYAHYSRALRRQSYGHIASRRAVRSAAGYLAGYLPVGLRGRGRLLELSADPVGGIGHTGAYFDFSARSALLTPASLAAASAGVGAERIHAATSEQALLQRYTRADFKTYLPGDVLVKVDRASMLASLEVRAPWLSRAIIEFAFHELPGAMRATSSATKILPRLLAAKLLPPEVVHAPKRGFAFPINHWLRTEGRQLAEDVLSTADAALFQPHAVRNLLEGHRRGRSNGQRIYSLLVFELWRRKYGVTLA